MAAKDLLPLFPLEVVLLPGAKLPLHIFEDRYREMVGGAIKNKSEFGVVLAAKEKMVSVGCTAIVEQVTQRYQDGRFDVETLGRRRFRTIELNEDLAYLRASVEYFEDDSHDPADLSQVSEVATLAQQLAKPLNASVPPESELSPFQPSFQIAGALPLELTFKQKLLSKRSEKERLSELTTYLTELEERVRRAQRAQRLAGTNGQVMG